MPVCNSNYSTKTFDFPVIAQINTGLVIYHFANLYLTKRHLIIGPSCLNTWAELSQNRSRAVSN